MLIQEDDTTGSGQPLPEMEASASRHAEGGSRDLQCALQGSRALADFTMGVGEQVTPIESVGDRASMHTYIFTKLSIHMYTYIHMNMNRGPMHTYICIHMKYLIHCD